MSPARRVPMLDSALADMIRIPGGTFRMGSAQHYPEEAPAARHAEPVDTSTNHVGFRCVVRSSQVRS